MINIEIPSVPHLVHIETTYACNQSCIFCYNPNRNACINMHTLDAIVQKVYDSWIPHVYLIGGEPSLLGVEKLNEYIDLLSERSSVTIVTNGIIYLEGLSNKLACIGVPVHGVGKLHDIHADNIGSFDKAKASIAKYVSCGFDVRCIPVLTKMNYDHIGEIIQFASEMGMESVFVDRYEDGGIGSARSSELKLSMEEFNIALDQMIAARDKFRIPVGWGTAIPFCLNEKMLSCDMKADCGAGITFAAVSPNGDVRICNQSEHIYGNLLSEKTFQEIWHNPAINEFRSLKWAKDTICDGCRMIGDCLCGCKVDASVEGEYAIDYSIRACSERPHYTDINYSTDINHFEVPGWRHFCIDPYTKINEQYGEKYLVTRYQTVIVDEYALRMLKQIRDLHITSEESLHALNPDLRQTEVKDFITDLERAQAIHFIGG